MKRIAKRIVAVIMAAVVATSMAFSVSAEDVGLADWSVYQHQGAPSSDNKYDDWNTGVAISTHLLVLTSTFNMSSNKNHVYVYSSKGISSLITDIDSRPSCAINPGESFVVSYQLKIEDNTYLTNSASGFLGY